MHEHLYLEVEEGWKPPVGVGGKEQIFRANAEYQGDICLHLSSTQDGDDAELTLRMTADMALRLAGILTHAARLQGQATVSHDAQRDRLVDDFLPIYGLSRGRRNG